MSLGVAFKGPEGIVLAADSRVTLHGEEQRNDTPIVIPATYDNATKLIYTQKQPYIGVITYGLGALGASPRTAHSFLPEFETKLPAYDKNKKDKNQLSVLKYSQTMSEFFMDQWNNLMPNEWDGPAMEFVVGGYESGNWFS